MKLIIDIPDHVYEWVKNTGKFGMYRFDTAKVIQNGIPLDDVKAEIDELYDRAHPYNVDVAQGLEMALGILDNIGNADMRGE